MADERKSLWQGIKDSVAEANQRYQERAAETAARGLVDDGTTLTIYRDGTFTTKSMLWGESERDRLLGFEHDVDSMRRKSTSGRGAAAVMTGGMSPSGLQQSRRCLRDGHGREHRDTDVHDAEPERRPPTTIRSLKAATDAVLAQASPTVQNPSTDVAAQLKQLADLHAAGALSDVEFAAAKGRLLG